MTDVFIVTDSSSDDTVAFSNIGTALDYVRDTHGDINPDGSTLMLQGSAGPVPATNKAVKAARGRVLRFEAAGADAVSKVAAVQSKLDGAIQACVGMGIDPLNVAKVAELQEDLAAAQVAAQSECDDSTEEIVITRLTLHKRPKAAASK